jgi:multidrug resistance efflux pump
MQIIQFLITLATVVLVGLLGRAMWGVYMGAPWTRDATVRAYVVTVAPEVAGRIVELPAVDNKFVHKGDLLVEIDPTTGSQSVKPRRRCSRRRRTCRTSTHR